MPEPITQINRAWILTRSTVWCVLVTLLLLSGGCATVPAGSADAAVPSGEQVTAAEGSAEEAKSEPAAEENLPQLELDATLLEQLLVTSLATSRGDMNLAVENAFNSATSTRDPRLARLATLLSLRINRYARAAEAAQLWLELQPDSANARDAVMVAQVGAGNVEEALQYFKDHYSEQDLDVQIREVAGILVRQSNKDAALDIASHFTEQHPQSAQVMLSSAYVADSFKSNTLASKWLEQALELKPGWDLAAQMKASMLRKLGKLEEMGDYVRDFVSAYPESVPMRMNLAAEQARDQSYDEALTTVQSVLQDEPNDVSALNYAAALASQLEQPELALQYYQHAVEIEPDNEDVRWALARHAAQQKNYLRAEQHFQKITSEDNFLRAQLQVANMRFHTRSLKDAINTLRALDPLTEEDYVDIAITRHYLLMQGREYEEALGYINETLIYLPDNTELKYARALVAAELNEVQTAEQDLRYIIGLQPNHANALNALGYTLADQTDRYEEAKALISKALELRPKDAHILDSMGWVLYRLKDFDGALDYLQQAFEVSAEVEVGAHLGEVLWESGQHDKANDVWRNALDIDAENPLLQKTLLKYGVQP